MLQVLQVLQVKEKRMSRNVWLTLVGALPLLLGAALIIWAMPEFNRYLKLRSM